MSEPLSAAGRLPVQLTSFVGRAAELTEVRTLLGEHRMVTLTGPGGVGKTRLAARLAGEFGDGVWWADLAALADPDLVAVRVARAMGLPDQPGRSTLDSLTRFIGDRPMLLVLDNCEHLLDGCATLVTELLSACPGLRIAATSREPIGVAGELTLSTPPLSLADEAIQLFADRAQLARPDFTVTDETAATVAQICERLDGIPLAIELAAARVRAQSPAEILDGLHDRLRSIRGARTAEPRQQTLYASVDWSHDLLDEPERILLRRLSVFRGGFDRAAASAVSAGTDTDQTFDQLSRLIDKSLVVVDTRERDTRYRLLETVRHYAREKLDASGETDLVRSRHRDHYTTVFDTKMSGDVERWTARADVEIDNLRTAFAYSRDSGDTELAARLASALQPLWLAKGRIMQGLNWFDSILSQSAAMTPATRARALADKLILDHSAGIFDSPGQADQALAVARGLDDPDLLGRVLTACGVARIFFPEVALPYFAEAAELVRALGDDWQLSWILAWQANATYQAGDPAATRIAAEKGRDLADAIGEGVLSRMCRWLLGQAMWLSGDLASAAAQFSDVITRAQAARDPMWNVYSLFMLARTLAYQGDTSRARVTAERAINAATDISGVQRALTFGAKAYAALAGGDTATATAASDTAWQACPQVILLAVNAVPIGHAALASGDVCAAHRWADDALSIAKGAHRTLLLAVRARTAIAQRDFEQARRDAHDALAVAAETQAYLAIPDLLECLACPAADSGDCPEAARLLGAAAVLRERSGQARFKVYHADYAASVSSLRNALGDGVFDAEWAAGGSFSTTEAIAYAQRGRGERKRPATGWASLTPTECDVARLAGEGLSNKDIAARLFVSPRTVQTHLTHIYTKLGVSSRVQLAQEAARQG